MTDICLLVTIFVLSAHTEKPKSVVKKRLKQTTHKTQYSKVRHSTKNGTQLSPHCFAPLDPA